MITPFHILHGNHKLCLQPQNKVQVIIETWDQGVDPIAIGGEVHEV
jgi:hypothetical protein